MKLAIVTASANLPRARDCFLSWHRGATPVTRYVVANPAGLHKDDPRRRKWTDVQVLGEARYTFWADDYLGVVPAFALGLQQALEDGADVVACLHDDLSLWPDAETWARRVLGAFADPRVGLVGFGGALGLGAADIYRSPYDPMQLVRHDFLSNMQHAEAHGRRELEPKRVACLDGFSLIGRKEFWLGQYQQAPMSSSLARMKEVLDGKPAGYSLLDCLKDQGVIHHAYDAALGAYAARLGWEVWYLPVACHHHGGITAVTDAKYHAWAAQQLTLQYTHADGSQQTGVGDAAFWLKSHRAVYDEFRDVLPIRVD